MWVLHKNRVEVYGGSLWELVFIPNLCKWLINTGVLVSGDIITEFHRFCDFLQIVRESQESFYRQVNYYIQQYNAKKNFYYRNQCFYAAPAINQAYTTADPTELS